QAEDAILARGRVLLHRARTLMAVSAALLLLRVPSVAFVIARRRAVRVAEALLPPVGTPPERPPLFVRGLRVPQAPGLVAFVMLRREPGLGTVIGMAADLPLFLWIAYYLRTQDRSTSSAFGLWPRRQGWVPLVGVTVALIATALLSDTLIELAS